MIKQIKTVDNERGIVQITTVDERFYALNTKNASTGLPEYRFVPSVTWIAGYYPKGVPFYRWLADHGWDESQAIKQAAGDKGSRVHYAINDLIQGNEVKMEGQYPNSAGEVAELSVQEYECVMSFADWFKEEEPKIIKSEYVTVNAEQGYAGTVDLKCRIKSDSYENVWIIDFKTSANIWTEYELQVSAYRHADAECQRTGILQVGYKRNKAHYKFTEVEDKFDLFLTAQKIWKNENDNVTPSQKDYPLSLQLTIPPSLPGKKKNQ